MSGLRGDRFWLPRCFLALTKALRLRRVKSVVRMNIEQDPALVDVHRIVHAPESELHRVFEDLRRRKRLYETVHQLNLLLHEPAYRGLAEIALKRLGLRYSG